MKYIKMVIPKFGKFTNGKYDIVGVIWLGSVVGKCTYSYYEHLIHVGKWVELPEYHLNSDIAPQFYRKPKPNE
jgi:hypothetical protein